jgi:hypothetical protein
MTAFPNIADRISPLIGKLGSPHDGEVLSAARALLRQLDKYGLSFNDLGGALMAAPAPAPRHEAAAFYDYLQACEWVLRTNGGALSARDLRFAEDMRGLLYRYPPTPKQAAWLRGLVEKLGGRFDG